jgi:hypothetical protein
MKAEEMERRSLFFVYMIVGTTLWLLSCSSEPKANTPENAQGTTVVPSAEFLKFRSELLKLKDPELGEMSFGTALIGPANTGNVPKARMVVRKNIPAIRSTMASLREAAQSVDSAKIPLSLPAEAQKGYQSYLESMGKLLNARAQNMQSLVVFAQTGDANALISYFKGFSKLEDTEHELDQKREVLDRAAGISENTH